MRRLGAKSEDSNAKPAVHIKANGRRLRNACRRRNDTCRGAGPQGAGLLASLRCHRAAPGWWNSPTSAVKSRTLKRDGDTFVVYNVNDQFDWLASVLLPGGGQETRRIFMIPRALADARHETTSPRQAQPMTAAGDRTR